MKTILFQLNQLGYGGTEKAIYTLIKNIDQNRFKVKLFFYSDVFSFNYYKIKILSFFIKKYKKKFNQKYRINFARKDDFLNLIEKDNFYIGNANDFFSICNDKNINIIHFNRGAEEDFYTDRTSEIPNHILVFETNIFGKKSNEIYLERLSSIFFVSNWLIKKEVWSKNYNSVALYNPICLPKSNLDLKSDYDISDNKIVLGRISRPNLDDGEFIFNVLNKISNKHVVLLVLGASEVFKNKTKDWDNIICLEPTTNEALLSKFYNSLDLLLHYRVEGETFGMNIAEAMIHGKPVVSHYSSVDNAQAELLLEEHESGIVVEEGNLDAYIDAVNKLIDNPDTRLLYGKNAKAKAEKLYSEINVTKVLEDEYNKALENKDT